mmetsp:Transcript_33830/g.104439  ORF Transcript_33830/g.104439 Transcript_33830/m.104439 type:complete len:495 (+) Transcript_33830:552-2036(+)
MHVVERPPTDDEDVLRLLVPDRLEHVAHGGAARQVVSRVVQDLIGNLEVRLGVELAEIDFADALEVDVPARVADEELGVDALLRAAHLPDVIDAGKCHGLLDQGPRVVGQRHPRQQVDVREVRDRPRGHDLEVPQAVPPATLVRPREEAVPVDLVFEPLILVEEVVLGVATEGKRAGDVRQEPPPLVAGHLLRDVADRRAERHRELEAAARALPRRRILRDAALRRRDVPLALVVVRLDVVDPPALELLPARVGPRVVPEQRLPHGERAAPRVQDAVEALRAHAQGALLPRLGALLDAAIAGVDEVQLAKRVLAARARRPVLVAVQRVEGHPAVLVEHTRPPLRTRRCIRLVPCDGGRRLGVLSRLRLRRIGRRETRCRGGAAETNGMRRRPRVRLRAVVIVPVSRPLRGLRRARRRTASAGDGRVGFVDHHPRRRRVPDDEQLPAVVVEQEEEGDDGDDAEHHVPPALVRLRGRGRSAVGRCLGDSHVGRTAQ